MQWKEKGNRNHLSSFTAVTPLKKAASWAPDVVSNSPAEILKVRNLIKKK